MFALLGLVITGAPAASATGAVEFDAPKPTVAIIDRDHGVVAVGLVEFMSERATLVDLEDDVRALQDATATNAATYILIIPAGYSEQFMLAAREGRQVPELECVVSVAESSGVMVDALVSSYLNAMRICTIGFTDLSSAELVERAQEAAAVNAPLSVIQSTDQISRASLLPFYFKWSSYPLTSGISILVSLLYINFQRGELRRRNLSTPLSPTRMNLQIAASCLVVAVLTWAFFCLMAMTPIVGGLELLRANPLSFVLVAITALLYTLVPLALGFLLSQFSLNETAINGAVNIISLSFTFLSGIMMGGSYYLDSTMLTIARFVPSYWYSEAIEAVVSAPGFSPAQLQPFFTCIGVMLLFALALFSVALLISRLRVQSSEAGGNTAAEAVA